MTNSNRITIKTILSQSGHEQTLSKGDLIRANANFITSLGMLRSLELDGVVVTCRRIHLGRGIYPPGRNTSLHRHDDLQIEYVLAGAFVFSCAGMEIEVRAGQVLLVPPALPHCWRCVRQGAMLGAELVVAGPAAQDFLRSLRLALNDAMLRIDDDRIAAWANQMLDIAVQPAPYAWRRAMLGSLLYLWLAQIFKRTMPIEPWRQAVPYTKQVAGDRSRLLVRQALDFMQANYGMAIGLENIAAQLGITPRHLTRLFRQYEQKSVKMNLLGIRLRHAGAMLASAKAYAIKEIAFRCGFASPSHFTHCFKRAFGRVPSQVTESSVTSSLGPRLG